ncbi:GIY-YIG nuclease family protein [Pseudoxanthomonas mexicana]|uniref:GIY-YIG nuclease family protein n=1 Tax=Pseudoxanthomonas mexicana TaxID=128785 RepID=UPI0028AC6265|nr:GIY-YIG nuclease family protein [Pseudoxanthomonas mexicana]
MTNRHNIGRSEKYHALPRTLYALNVVTATRAEAEAHEQAWRVRASKEGWRVYAKPPGIVINPHRRATPHVRCLALQCRWNLGTPSRRSSERIRWWPWIAVGASLLLLARCVTG